MGHSDYANNNDGIDAPSPHDDDENLYSRRASAHTLYSTTASSGPSSPTFSRRGSAATNNPALSPPHPGARRFSERGLHSIHPYGNPRSTLPVLPGSRPGHDGPPPGVVGDQPPLLNYDGIIKHPSRHPYARSHHSHHHPYAYPFPPPPSSSPSTTLAHNHDSNPNLRQHPPPPGHPYYTQKRHSFAALRTGSSSSSSRTTSHNMAAMAGPSGNNSPPLPLVRLPSIDHGLPPFPSDSGMVSRTSLLLFPSLVRLCWVPSSAGEAQGILGVFSQHVLLLLPGATPKHSVKLVSYVVLICGFSSISVSPRFFTSHVARIGAWSITSSVHFRKSHQRVDPTHTKRKLDRPTFTCTQFFFIVIASWAKWYIVLFVRSFFITYFLQA